MSKRLLEGSKIVLFLTSTVWTIHLCYFCIPPQIKWHQECWKASQSCHIWNTSAFTEQHSYRNLHNFFFTVLKRNLLCSSRLHFDNSVYSEIWLQFKNNRFLSEYVVKCNFRNIPCFYQCWKWLCCLKETYIALQMYSYPLLFLSLLCCCLVKR